MNHYDRFQRFVVWQLRWFGRGETATSRFLRMLILLLCCAHLTALLGILGALERTYHNLTHDAGDG